MKKIILPILLSLSFCPIVAHAGGHEKAPVIESDYILPTQVTGTIFNNYRAAGIMQVDVAIYTKDPKMKGVLSQLKPVLAANWRIALQDYLGRYYRPGQVPDSVMLQALMQKSVAQQFGRSDARVIIQAVVAH